MAPSSSKPTTLSVATPLRKHNKQGNNLTWSFTVKKGASCRHRMNQAASQHQACSLERGRGPNELPKRRVGQLYRLTSLLHCLGSASKQGLSERSVSILKPLRLAGRHPQALAA